MQRSDSPLNKLFDAARQEQSPLSEDDVRALLNKPQTQKQRPIMIPILIAGVIITIAGITSSVVLIPTNESNPRLPASVETTSTTPTPVTTPPTPSIENTSKSIVKHVSIRTTDASTATSNDAQTSVQPIVFDWQRDTDGEAPALCQIKCVYPATSTNTSNENVKVYFATVRANRDVTDRLAMPSAPVPVLCTDSRGRACSPTDVAFFPANYTGIAGKLNNLVPVTYEGRQDILAWYEPSTELVQAFPDSMQDELVTLLDIDIDVEFEMPDMPDMPHISDMPEIRVPQRPFRINSFNIDSMIGVVKSQLGCVDSNAMQNNSFKTFKFNDSTFKTFKFDDSYFKTFKFDDSTFKFHELNDSSMKSFRFRLNTEGDTNDISIEYGASNNQMNLDSVAAYYRKFSKSTYTDMKDLGNYEELMKQPRMIATMRNADSTMKMLQLYYGSDSLCKMPSELLDQHGVERLGSTPTKKVYKIRKKITLDSTVNDADSNSKQRFQSRIVIKSTTKRNKNSQVVPSVEKLSELTPTANGAITSSNVYPNPATDGGATMSFVLSEPRTLKLTLLDLNGNVVATLMTDAKRTPGNGQFAFTLNNIPSGMYLATLTTDKGERAMQRLIVQ